jgi:hypothetical protein
MKWLQRLQDFGKTNSIVKKAKRKKKKWKSLIKGKLFKSGSHWSHWSQHSATLWNPK